MAKVKNVKSKKNSRLVFWGQLIIAVILIATMSLAFLPMGRSGPVSSAAPDFPPWIAGLKIQNYITGEDAKKQLSNMFAGETTTFRDAWVAFYDENAVVWIGQANSESEADKLLNVIREKTQSAISSTPELKLLPVNKKGITVYAVRFGNQYNYIYQRYDKIFWLSVPYDKGEPFLNEVIDNLN